MKKYILILYVLLTSTYVDISSVHAGDEKKVGNGGGGTISTPSADILAPDIDMRVGTGREVIVKNINTFIIDSYKTQGEKILKELDLNLQKTAPDIETRIEMYAKIGDSIDARIDKINAMKVSDNKKIIMKGFLVYMSDGIGYRVKSLKKALNT